jgi:hypothetical protein
MTTPPQAGAPAPAPPTVPVQPPPQGAAGWVARFPAFVGKYAHFFGFGGLLAFLALLWLKHPQAATVVTGIISVLFWWLSALISAKFNPNVPVGDASKDPNLIPKYLKDIYSHLAEFSDALQLVARLNTWAAIFTGISVLLTIHPA